MRLVVRVPEDCKLDLAATGSRGKGPRAPTGQGELLLHLRPRSPPQHPLQPSPAGPGQKADCGLTRREMATAGAGMLGKKLTLAGPQFPSSVRQE